MTKWKTWTAAVSIFVFGVLVGREWVKYELRSAIAGAFSGLSGAGATEPTTAAAVEPAALVPDRPAVRRRPELKMKQKGIRKFAGNGCRITYEVESSPGGFMVQAFAVGHDDGILDSTNELLKPAGGLVEFSFVRTPCASIKGLRWQVQ